MTKIHKVKQGEYLSLIANKYQISDWRKLYNYQDDEFKRQRPNPDLIYPGDKLLIPELEHKQKEVHTDQHHRFRLFDAGDWIKVRLRDSEDQSLVDLPYKLTFTGCNREYEDDTGMDGIVHHPIPPSARQAILEVWGQSDDPNPTCCWQLSIGELDPMSDRTLSGTQARLNNLGFKCGVTDGKNGPKTTAAVEKFQEKHKNLTVDGIAGSKTREQLEKVYGC